MRTSARITLWVASFLLAIVFLAGGMATFASPTLRQYFTHSGYPGWLRGSAGVLAIVCAGMLLVPRLAWRAAFVLGVMMLAGTIVLWWHGETLQAVAPVSALLGVSIVGYARHPRATFMRRLHSAVDFVAERELAEQRRRVAVQRALKALKGPARKRRPTLVKGPF
jgi:uncharacterized membrane protein YphA (DoxX/SURF4 family)